MITEARTALAAGQSAAAKALLDATPATNINVMLRQAGVDQADILSSSTTRRRALPSTPAKPPVRARRRARTTPRARAGPAATAAAPDAHRHQVRVGLDQLRAGDRRPERPWPGPGGELWQESGVEAVAELGELGEPGRWREAEQVVTGYRAAPELAQRAAGRDHGAGAEGLGQQGQRPA